jgi:hypothetical protein
MRSMDLAPAYKSIGDLKSGDECWIKPTAARHYRKLIANPFGVLKCHARSRGIVEVRNVDDSPFLDGRLVIPIRLGDVWPNEPAIRQLP